LFNLINVMKVGLLYYSSHMNERAKAILDFWFIQSNMEDWFKKDDKYDEKIKKLFLDDLKKASNNEYDEWQDTAKECVALVILLDQFSRNLYRDSSAAFAQDYKTRLIVNEAVDRGYLEELEQNKIHFLLMPLIHSEDISDHIFGHKLIDTYLKSFEHFDKIKKAWNDHTIPIKKFGRYPHRNKILKRKSTPEEEAFLNQPDSSW
tara:strand:- start:342 stop:956 length:615 start_codon:yes stop_codon:yes gene_type:complete